MDVGVQLINSTTIKVSWFAVDRESVRGHLLGYKVLLLHPLLFIFFCLTSETRTHDVVLVAPDTCNQKRIQEPPPRPAVQGVRERCGGRNWSQRSGEGHQ